jgi:chemotaxis protein CheD
VTATTQSLVNASDRLIVGVGELVATNLQHVTVSTYALGSCVALVGYEPRLKIGGIIHIMLPTRRLDNSASPSSPARFVDSGIPMFFQAMRKMGATPKNLSLALFGGANTQKVEDHFKIGQRNAELSMRMLQKFQLDVAHSDLGGAENRTIHLTLKSGEILMRCPSGNRTFQLVR